MDISLILQNNLKVISKQSKDLPTNVLHSIIQLIINSIEGKRIGIGALNRLQVQCGIKVENIEQLYSLFHSFIKQFLFYPSNALKEDLFRKSLNELSFNKEITEELIECFYGEKRIQLDRCLKKLQPRLPSIEKLNWTLDILVSSSTVSRVLEPYIMLEIQTTNGDYIRIHISMKKFHQFRHAVALLLADMCNAKNKPFFNK